MSDDHPIAVAAIAAALGPLAPRFDVDVLAECDSTNARLVAKAESGAPSGTVIVALRQTAGRGRMGRVWHADQQASLTFSLLWRLPRGLGANGLSLAVGVAVVEALHGMGIEGLALKWPNDVLLAGGKLGGVLVELVAGTQQAAVIGIGLNLRLPENLPSDVRSTAAALNRTLDRNVLLAKLLASLHGVLSEFAAGGFVSLRPRWNAFNAHADSPVRLLSMFAAPVDGFCRGVDIDGALLLETSSGVGRVISGEVSLKPA
jgi:BirA family biotin operon repressor/biotin-[acetyl-CoA-carboxylase] ligase